MDMTRLSYLNCRGESSERISKCGVGKRLKKSPDVSNSAVDVFTFSIAVHPKESFQFASCIVDDFNYIQRPTFVSSVLFLHF